MNFLARLSLVSLCFHVLVASASALEPGFIPILDKDHTDGWKQCGKGDLKISDGVATARYSSSTGSYGVAWYTKRTFTNFVLKLEFKGMLAEFNSGVRLRFPAPGDDPKIISEQGYEVAIDQRRKPDVWITGAIYGEQAAQTNALKPNDWNEFEITAFDQHYTVSLNGKVVNVFTGRKLLSGFVGLEEHRIGPVQFRNVRIKDLASTAPSPAPVPAYVTPSRPAPVAPPAIAIDPNQPLLDTFSQLAPNATAWVLAPLEQGVPLNIRQNLTFLREDLLDEGKSNHPKASREAYTLGCQLCSTMIAALDERDQTLVRAGYRAAQADATTGISNDPTLSTHRNYMMSWPQYAREVDQRSELKNQALNNAQVMKEQPKVDWSNRTARLHRTLDNLYAEFREALRQSAVVK